VAFWLHKRELQIPRCARDDNNCDVISDLSRAFARLDSRGGCPHATKVNVRWRGRPRHTSSCSCQSVEFERNKFRFLLADVGEGVGVAAGEPFHIARLEMSGHGALAFDVAAHVEIGERHQ